jgi:hypothetical protein
LTVFVAGPNGEMNRIKVDEEVFDRTCLPVGNIIE